MDGLLILIVVAVLAGLGPAVIAEKKGHSFVTWWFFGAVLLIVALPVVFFIEDKNKHPCPSCHERIYREAKVCPFCREAVVEEAGGDLAPAKGGSSVELKDLTPVFVALGLGIGAVLILAFLTR